MAFPQSTIVLAIASPIMEADVQVPVRLLCLIEETDAILWMNVKCIPIAFI